MIIKSIICCECVRLRFEKSEAAFSYYCDCITVSLENPLFSANRCSLSQLQEIILQMRHIVLILKLSDVPLELKLYTSEHFYRSKTSDVKVHF